MRVLMLLAFALAVLPAVVLLGSVWPGVRQRWRASSRACRAGLLLAACCGCGFLLARPHDNLFSGLDDAAYRDMARVFRAGRGFHDRDTVLAQVPPGMRQHFLFFRQSSGRPTRDRSFQVKGWTSAETQPYFLPFLPLAAGGGEPLLAAERFVPLMGSLWLLLTLLSGFTAGGGWGVMVALLLILGTPWPAWFLRGFYAEAVGGVLASAVVLAAAARAPRGWMRAVMGLALGLAVTFHPILVVVALPLILALALEEPRWRALLALAGGMMLGLFPAWLAYAHVCQPYGPVLNLLHVPDLLKASPIHRAIAWVLSVCAVLGAASLAARGRLRIHARLSLLPRRWRQAAWLLPLALPGGVLLAATTRPEPLWRELVSGAASVWSGIRLPFGLLLAAGIGSVLAGRRPLREKVMMHALLGGGLILLFIKGHEIPVGIWSQRRLLPAILMLVACLIPPLSQLLARLAARSMRHAAILVLLLTTASLANLIRWPAAYALVDEAGAKAWTDAVAERIGTDRWVIFDHYPHSVPYAPDLRHKVLGLNEESHEYWPETAAWVTALARTQEVWLASSWRPCTLEDQVRLDPVFATTGQFVVATCKQYLPVVTQTRKVPNHFLAVTPLGADPAPPQDKVMDGSPFGLRGPWSASKDTGGGRMARWTRQGSGIVGPVPAPGGHARIALTCAFDEVSPEWTAQEVRLTAPWGSSARVVVTSGWQTVELQLERAVNEGDGAWPTGVYRFDVERPYDPARYGLRGYPSDLGVQVRRVRIRAE